jgi:hypothetical protein
MDSNNAKKFLLVPPETMKQLNINPTHPLDKEVYNILRQNIGQYEKWTLYQQAVLRFNTASEPLKIMLEDNPVKKEREEVKSEPKEEPKVSNIEAVVKVLPSKFQNKGRQILNYTLERVKWNQNGVAIDGKSINGANIVDLVLDTIRKSSYEPVGFREFNKLIHELNVPIYFITNPERRVKQEDNKEHDQEKASASKEFITPQRTSTRTQKIDWKAWNSKA